MAQIVEVDEQGTIHLPRELLGDTPLPARYILEAQGDVLTLRKLDESFNREMLDMPHSAWFDRTPAERAAAIHDWIASLPRREGPPIPDEALRRENLYD